MIKKVFPEGEAAAITGLSAARLLHWNRTGFFKPSFRNLLDQGGDHNRLYTFTDLVCLRTLQVLIDEYEIRLPRLRETLKQLFDMDQSKWATERLYVLGKNVYFDPPEVEAFQETTSGQLALHHIELRQVHSDVEQAIYESRGRSKEDFGEIAKTRGIASSQPVIKGTRISVKSIKSLLDDGVSIDEVIKMYPSLTKADVKAAGEYDRAA